MNPASQIPEPRIAAATRTYPGETVCGDMVAWWREGDATFACIVDGLGHGPDAHQAARSLLALVEGQAGIEPTDRLVTADRAMRHTRGAAAALVRIDPAARTITVAAVGNIQGALFSTRTLRFDGMPGIVGAGLRPLKPLVLPFSAADILVLWTDGLRPVDLEADPQAARSDPERLAADLMASHGRQSDDCGVLCVAFRA
ncbi:SpoIIE family protein phosphatase [Methylobacterium sp. J-072]|uniref:SpoIIE family protein phosphatase n=1 Tax=Methylobacterium sp. J-072 TaxID=2836651 RepID=UPI001FBADEE8|nr:SpoIIE family protein phosphatase [Methylobacterium sp. J-072]MCJ2091954.1 SpoIIE family protein phosphatase [Methylobacterium sp. J-072]